MEEDKKKKWVGGHRTTGGGREYRVELYSGSKYSEVN